MKTKSLQDSYKETSKIIIYFILGAILIAALSFIIVTPMWFAALHFKSAFTLSVFIAIIASLICFFALSVKKDKKVLKKVAINILILLLSCGAAILVFCAVFLALHGFYLQAAVIGAVLFFTGGIIRFFAARKNDF